MGSEFTFDDISSSAPRSVNAAAAIAKLTEEVVAMKAMRQILAVTRPRQVAPLDHRISASERKLKQLMLGAGARRKKPAQP